MRLKISRKMFLIRRFCRTFAEKLRGVRKFCNLHISDNHQLSSSEEKNNIHQTASSEVRKIRLFLNRLFWVLVALYVTVIVLVHVPAVQRAIGSQVAKAVGEELGTTVQVGRVDLGFFNRLVIDDVLILDQQQKELLNAHRLTTKIDLLALMQGKVSISSVQVFGAHLKIYRRTASSPTNIQFVLDSLASKDTTTHTPLDLRINSLIMRHSSVSYDQYDQPLTPRRFNVKHLLAKDISAHIQLKTLKDDSIHVAVKRLSLREQSGLMVEKLAFRLTGGRDSARLEDFYLRLPASVLEIPALTASYRWKDDQPDVSTLRFSGDIHNSSVTPSDLSPFESSLQSLHEPVYLSTAFSGTTKSIQIKQLNMRTDTGFQLLGNGTLDLSDEQPAWSATLQRLQFTGHTIQSLAQALQQRQITLPAAVTRLGSVQLQGAFSGEHGAMKADSRLTTGAGSATLTASMNAQREFTADVTTNDLQLHQLLDNAQLGSLSAQLHASGSLPKGESPQVNVDGTINQVDFKGYSYRDIQLNGHYDTALMSGQFAVDDPNLRADLTAEIRHAKQHDIHIEGTIGQLALKALHLTDRWGDAHLSGDVYADLTANTLNDALGAIDIRQFTLRNLSDDETFVVDHLGVLLGYDDEGTHFVELDSDFATAMLKGDFTYETLPQSFINLLGTRLPTLPGLPKTKSNGRNNFTLDLTVSDSRWLQRFFGVNATLHRPLELHAVVNDAMNTLQLDAAVEELAYNDSYYRDANVSVTSPGDSLKCEMAMTKVTGDGDMMNWQLLAHAANNNLTTSLRWHNFREESPKRGQFNAITNLYDNLLGKSEAHIKVQPSHIIMNNETWEMEPSDIVYYDKHADFYQFSLHSADRQQHVVVDGTASTDIRDTVHVDLKNVDVAYILDLVNFHSVDFGGKASGHAFVSAPFSEMTAHANLSVHDFTFEDGRMGTLRALVDWNSEEEQIDIHAIANDGKNAQTHINGYVSPTREFIDLDIFADGTYLDFMHSFTKSFISQITGHAHGTVRLAGPLDAINLTGQLTADGEATITPLNTTYQLKNDTVDFLYNEIELRHQLLTDKHGNRGYLTGGIHHQCLKNLTYDLYLDADNLLAYDFENFGESNICGNVYATGNVDIHGRSGEVTINVDVTPQRGSTFYYNAAKTGAVEDQGFVVWNAPKTTTADGTLIMEHPEIEMPTDIYINFHLDITTDVALKLLMDERSNDYITLIGSGDLHALFHNRGPFQMFGTYTVDHGSYGLTIQSLIHKKFTFNEGGTIIFAGDPYNATLNLQAMHIVQGVSLSDLNIGNSFSTNTVRVNCLMNITGQPRQPKVDFDLQLPNVNAEEAQMIRSVINTEQEMNQQVLYLLGVGRFYTQGANNAQSTSSDRTSLAMSSLLSGTLSGQINNLLNNVIKSDNWNFGANISTGSEGWNNAEYEGIISGRMLNNRLLVNGQFGYRDNATKATPSFIGDFDIRYLLKRNGNIAVKFYNQTNDRYFTRTALNTQGIGLIIKKDFNGLSDLFSKKKKVGSEEKAKDKKADSKEKNDKSSKEKVSKAKSEPEAKAKTEPAKAPLIAKPKPDIATKPHSKPDIAAKPHSKPDAASPSHPSKPQKQPDYSEEPRGNNTSWIIFNQKI